MLYSWELDEYLAKMRRRENFAAPWLHGQSANWGPELKMNQSWLQASSKEQEKNDIICCSRSGQDSLNFRRLFSVSVDTVSGFCTVRAGTWFDRQWKFKVESSLMSAEISVSFPEDSHPPLWLWQCVVIRSTPAIIFCQSLFPLSIFWDKGQNRDSSSKFYRAQR